MSMVDEDVVQSLSRIRVHATERVEGKRNEFKAVLVTDILVRVKVVVVEQLKGRHRASLSTRLVINTNKENWSDHKWSHPEHTRSLSRQ